MLWQASITRDPSRSRVVPHPGAPAAVTCASGRESADLERRRYARRVDEALGHLAHQEARCRRALGLLARALLRHQAHQHLGFVRLGDYTRERLGLSVREVQSVAQVVHTMEQLPLTAGAFARGDISWAQVRALARVATPATEVSWLERARGRTVRALEALVRDAGGGGSAAGWAVGVPSAGATTIVTPAALTAAAAAVADEDAGLIDGEPAVRWRLHCPRRVRALWRAVVELARRVAGEPLTAWQATEAIAAEALSGASRSRAIDRPARQADDPGRLAQGDRYAGVRSRRESMRCEHRGAVGLHGRARVWNRPRRTAASTLDRARSCDSTEPDVSALRDATWPDIEALARDADRLDAFALDARLRATVRVLHTIDWRVGRLLRVLIDARIYTLRGFPSASQYIDERLGISRRKAWALLAIERATATAPALADAWQAGQVSWLRALTILPVLHPTVEVAWVTRAYEVTVRRLTDEVAWALDQQDLAAAPQTTAASLAIAPPPHGVALARFAVQLRALQESGHHDGALQYPAPRDGARNDAAPHDGPPHDPAPQEQEPHNAASGDHEPVDATLTLRGPASVIGLVHEAIRAFAAPPEPAWRSFARLLAHVRGEWERQPRHPDPIFARDGWRCAVPACSARGRLHDHHIHYRSRGGDNTRGNRIAVCAQHHLHAIHAGCIHACGVAPHAVHWELGVRPGRPPLLRFVGDRYVGARP
jgi:hypothetical protein